MKQFERMDKKFSVWVGGTEVTDYYVTYSKAFSIANKYREEGYDDVVMRVEEYKLNK